MKRFNGPSFLIFMLLFWCFQVFVGGVCIEYVAEFWGSIIKGTPIDVPFWICGIAGIVLAEVALPLALITVIASFII